MNTLRYVLSAVEAKRLSEDTTALKEGSVSSSPISFVAAKILPAVSITPQLAEIIVFT